MKKTMKVSLLATVAVLVAATAAHAGQNVTVEKNHTLRVTLAAPAGSVVVGNPDIADVTVIDSRTLYIVGKGFGSSGINVTGRDGRSLFDGEISVTAPQKGAITVYKGLKPSLMVCSNVCVAEDVTSSNTTMAPPPGVISMAPAAPSPAPAPQAAMIAQ